VRGAGLRRPLVVLGLGTGRGQRGHVVRVRADELAAARGVREPDRALARAGAGAATLSAMIDRLVQKGQEPIWAEAREFRGPWLTSVPEVLNLL